MAVRILRKHSKLWIRLAGLECLHEVSKMSGERTHVACGWHEGSHSCLLPRIDIINTLHTDQTNLSAPMAVSY